MDKKRVVGILILIIIAVLIWGFVGGQQSQKIGVTCDMGIGETLCWKWHTNIIGQIQEAVKDTGNTIKDFFDN